jgi:hypothetical protein
MLTYSGGASVSGLPSMGVVVRVGTTSAFGAEVPGYVPADVPRFASAAPRRDSVVSGGPFPRCPTGAPMV